MGLYRVGALPEPAVSAAAHFHAQVIPDVLRLLGQTSDHLTLVFAPADQSHRGWRLAVVQSLAREHAPLRVNAIESDDEAAISAAVAWIASAEGVTGQLLPLYGFGAGKVV